MIFRRYKYAPLHRMFGDGAVQDLRKLNGKFRAFIYEFLHSSENARDFDTFREAAEELKRMHARLFAGVVWC